MELSIAVNWFGFKLPKLVKLFLLFQKQGTKRKIEKLKTKIKAIVFGVFTDECELFFS